VAPGSERASRERQGDRPAAAAAAAAAPPCRQAGGAPPPRRGRPRAPVQHASAPATPPLLPCAQVLPGRSARQCRERWVEALDPRNVKGPWSIEQLEELKEVKGGPKGAALHKGHPGRGPGQQRGSPAAGRGPEGCGGWSVQRGRAASGRGPAACSGWNGRAGLGDGGQGPGRAAPRPQSGLRPPRAAPVAPWLAAHRPPMPMPVPCPPPVNPSRWWRRSRRHTPAACGGPRCAAPSPARRTPTAATPGAVSRARRAPGAGGGRQRTGWVGWGPFGACFFPGWGSAPMIAW
jgi:hypothetical protein